MEPYEFEFRRLKNWQVGGDRENMRLSIPLPKTPSGMVLQGCPSPGCVPGLFRIAGTSSAQYPGEEQRHLVRREPRISGTTCPYCGHDDSDEAFVSEEDQKAVVRLVEWAAAQDATDHLAEIAEEFNRTTMADGLISVRLDIGTLDRPRPYFRRDDLLRRLTCDVCGRNYGVFALGFFCPDCGARNIHVHFAREVDLVTRQLAIAEAEVETDSEMAYRLLTNAHEDVLTALEAYMKAMFLMAAKRRFESTQLDVAIKMKPSTFQNMKLAQRRFEYLSLDPFEGLTSSERGILEKNVQKRHIIGHNLGVSDIMYAESGGVEPLGQTVHLLADDVSQFGELCRKVVTHVEENLPELLPPRS